MARPSTAQAMARMAVTAGNGNRGLSPDMSLPRPRAGPAVASAAMPQVAGRTNASLALGALVLLLLVGYSTNLAAGFWSPRAAVVLVLAGAGAPALVRLCLTSS